MANATQLGVFGGINNKVIVVYSVEANVPNQKWVGFRVRHKNPLRRLFSRDPMLTGIAVDGFLGNCREDSITIVETSRGKRHEEDTTYETTKWASLSTVATLLEMWAARSSNEQQTVYFRTAEGAEAFEVTFEGLNQGYMLITFSVGRVELPRATFYELLGALKSHFYPATE